MEDNTVYPTEGDIIREPSFLKTVLLPSFGLGIFIIIFVYLCGMVLLSPFDDFARQFALKFGMIMGGVTFVLYLLIFNKIRSHKSWHVVKVGTFDSYEYEYLTDTNDSDTLKKISVTVIKIRGLDGTSSGIFPMKGGMVIDIPVGTKMVVHKSGTGELRLEKI